MKRFFVVMASLAAVVAIVCSFGLPQKTQGKLTPKQQENASVLYRDTDCWCTVNLNCICTCGREDYFGYANTYRGDK